MTTINASNGLEISDANTASTKQIRRIVEVAIASLINGDEAYNLKRESRRVFEAACLEEVLWESFVDEWIDVAYEAAGERTSVLDYHDLTDWCVCGHSNADHGLDCHTCDCQRFKRSRRAARPTPRRAGRSPIAINRARCIELENARYRHLFGDLTGGAL